MYIFFYMNAFVLKIVKEIPVAGEFDLASSLIGGAVIHSVNFSHCNSSTSFCQYNCHINLKDFFPLKEELFYSQVTKYT